MERWESLYHLFGCFVVLPSGQPHMLLLWPSAEYLPEGRIRVSCGRGLAQGRFASSGCTHPCAAQPTVCWLLAFDGAFGHRRHNRKMHEWTHIWQIANADVYL